MPALSVDRLNEALSDRYAVERELGEGGMATVYLAQDLKHSRMVALKVLKPELSAVVGAERFLAEIETTANLQHPHILPLFDSGEADGFLFYVMPYVEGETLRDRLARDKQLSIEESVRIGTAVAGALDYAHRHGVVHRDIKPANILLQDGEPVVSDFGIALAVGAGGGARLTETGLSVGTPFYMSPEQATGDQHIGPASDIYSLGCVVYEMLVGEPPFLGNTAQAVLGKIIQGGPVSATEVRKSVPPNIGAAIRKALEKLPADRFTSAQDFGRALGDPGFRHGIGVGAAATGAGAWRLAAIGFAATTLVALGGLLWSLFGTPGPTPRVERFASPFLADQEPDGLGYQFFDLAPDGSFMVYRSGSILWTRRWEDLEATQIRGSRSGWAPAISPDGTQVSFWLTSGEVQVAPLAGGPLRTVLEGAQPWRHWADDGFIYATMQGEIADGLVVVRVAPSGGAADTLPERMPRWHPDGQNVTFISPRSGQYAIWTRRADGTGEATLVYEDSRGPIFDFAWSPDASRLVLRIGGASGVAGARDLHVLEVGRDSVAQPLLTSDFDEFDPAISPDGRWLAYVTDETGQPDVFVRPFADVNSGKVQVSDGGGRAPVWSPDGTRSSTSGGAVSPPPMRPPPSAP